jgi:hypothetical protein
MNEAPGSGSTTPNGFTGHMFFEAIVRQFIAYHLKEIQKSCAKPGETFIDELFARYGEEVRRQIKLWFIETTNIGCQITFPRGDMSLPLVCVVNAAESEKTDETYLSDHGGVMYAGKNQVTSSSKLTTPPNVYGEVLNLPDDRPKATSARHLISIPENHTTRIYIATDDVNATVYLYTVIKALLVVNKLDFDKYAGARNLKLNGGDIEHKPELFPQFAFFKVLDLSYDQNFDVALAKDQTIGNINVSLSAFLFGGASASVGT